MQIADNVGQTLSSCVMHYLAKKLLIGTEERPVYTQPDDQSLIDLASSAGEHPAETWLRLQIESDGLGLFHVRFVNEDLSVLPDYLNCDWIVPGGRRGGTR